jgi:hypothetical protein
MLSNGLSKHGIFDTVLSEFSSSFKRALDEILGLHGKSANNKD